MRCLPCLYAVCLLALLLAAPKVAPAAGFQTLEQGTPDIGRAMVGAITGDTAATAFYNPAAMVNVEKPELATGVMSVLGDTRFDPDPATTFTGGNGGQVFEDAFLPGALFYVHPLSEEWTAGASFTFPFAGTLDYDRDWVGRYVVQSVDFITYDFTGSLAYRVSDKLSLGVAASVVYGFLDEKLALNTPALLPDGRVHIDEADQWQFGWVVSALWEPVEGTQLAMVYRSEIDLDDLEGDLRIDAPGLPGFSFGLTIGLSLPQAAAVGLRQQISEDLTVYADFAWAEFSSFGMQPIDLSGGVSVDSMYLIALARTPVATSNPQEI